MTTKLTLIIMRTSYSADEDDLFSESDNSMKMEILIMNIIRNGESKEDKNGENHRHEEVFETQKAHDTSGPEFNTIPATTTENGENASSDPHSTYLPLLY